MERHAIPFVRESQFLKNLRRSGVFLCMAGGDSRYPQIRSCISKDLSHSLGRIAAAPMRFHDVVSHLIEVPFVFPYQTAGTEQLMGIFQDEAPDEGVASQDVPRSIVFPRYFLRPFDRIVDGSVREPTDVFRHLRIACPSAKCGFRVCENKRSKKQSLRFQDIRHARLWAPPRTDISLFPNVV